MPVNAPQGLGEPGVGLRRPKRSLRWKLLVALTSFLLVLALLESLSWYFVASIHPVRVRDGFYENPLSLFTAQGGPPIDFSDLPQGAALPTRKGDGEIRIVALGESSVEGSPFDIRASMPAMLLDELRLRLPDRRFTVVNMGRSSSVATNVFYYLAYLERFSPDFYVFYMGMNDHEGMGGEQAAAVTHPRLHAIWRGLVKRSHALWLARTYGVRWLWSWTGRRDWYTEGRWPLRSFDAWTDILLDMAREQGATTIVATPVVSAATPLESDSQQASRDTQFRELSPDYRALLTCRLDPSCDFPQELAALLRSRSRFELAGGGPLDRLLANLGASLMREHENEVTYRFDSWRRSAERTGATLIEFHRILRENSPDGLLSERFFADRQHLLPLGYLFLARLTAAQIEARLTGAPVTPVPCPRPEEAFPYVEQSAQSGLEIALEQLARGWYLTGVPLLTYLDEQLPASLVARKSAAFQADVDTARVALGWLRLRAGLPHGLPAALAERLEGFTPYSELERVRVRNRQRTPDGSGI